MQNKPNSMKQFWKDKGYYILLGLCIVAVGVSGYFFVTGALRENEAVEQTLSVPVTVEEPEDQTPQKPQKPSSQTVPTTVTESETTQTESAAVSGETTLPVLAEEPEVVLPVNGSVLQDHAMDRLVYHATTQDWRVHNGVDLAAELGQTVVAARAGTVSAVYDDELYGTTVVIQHADGYTSHYCNLAAPAMVAAGDTVSAGQPVGAIGETALIETASEPHLHFEVYCGGEPVDPAGFLY